MAKPKRKIWLIGDTHFNHDKLAQDLGRPSNYETLIWQGLKKLGKNDVLIHLGDICVGEDEKINRRLGSFKFKKYLVRGNHDGKSNNWYLNRGWDFVCKEFKDKYFGYNILFSHKPVPVERDYDFNIHGHFHNIPAKYHEEDLVAIKNERQILFTLEDLDYKPVLLEDFIQEKSLPK